MESSENFDGTGFAAAEAPSSAWANRWSRLVSRPRWQQALVLGVALILALWLILVMRSLTMATATVLVTERVHGIADPNALFDFGDLPRTAGIDHKLTIKNEGMTDTLVMVVVTGEIHDFVTIDDSTFSLRPGEERQVKMTLKVPTTAEVDKRYSGRAMIVRLPYWNPF